MRSKKLLLNRLFVPSTLSIRNIEPKRPPGSPKMADGVWKGVYPLIIGGSEQLSQNRLLDSKCRCMRKGCDGENGKWRKN